MREKKYRPEDVLKILRFCATGASCDECPMTQHDCANTTHAQLSAEVIEELLAQLRWVPVGERLPDLIPCSASPGHGYSEAVQICTAGKKVLTAVYSHKGWLFDKGFWDAWDETVTHWRPVVGNLPWAGEGV